MTAVELYRAEKARHLAKQEAIFAPIRAQLAALVDAHPQSAMARASAGRYKGLPPKERNAAYYRRTKAHQKAKRDQRATNAKHYATNRTQILAARKASRAAARVSP